ncbi:hypothetical protein D0T84_14145 [Dysgonomonas sp. 521]|uniref:hypothetical protein n=1 Tax=Dysgonomonas sp. 521 TaxID=2302932 RepID=UPI0013D194ED|nr:hypothetical protein [Dysgonomonas sp. 521]NDV96045.1 hypothetical protein [Dysgonomonas sp. 521]
MRTLLVTLFILLAANISAQETADKRTVIEMNTQFTLKLVKTDTGYDCTVINKEPYNQLIDLKTIYSLLPDSNIDEIHGVLAYTNYENNLNAFLILKSGVEVPLKYNLGIKREDNTRFEKSSALNLFPDMPSTEVWPFRLDGVLFSGFNDAVTE